jgi:hypothetical protein
MPLYHLFLCPLGCINLASSLYGLEATGTPAVMLEVLSHFRGITVEIGGDTTGLSKALSGVNKEIRNT